MSTGSLDGTEIAIIGMSCRFPGAPDLNSYWRNLRDGVESIHHFSDDELRALGVDQATLDDPRYVKAAAFLDDPDVFDAAFFDISHREAEITDPQHRVLLECAWLALEHAGYNPLTYPGAISVYAGATINTYLLLNLAANPQAIANLEQVQLNIGNAGDFLATRIAYKLNLKGASYTVQSACSTSLVAVHLACENLLNEACDMALAGGVSVNVSFQRGYRYLEGGMSSPDGRCRPFDSQAQGTIFGSGAGLVVLKRLEDALRDGDTVHAVIKGSAVNNDGSFKVGYTAPGVEGQAQVITEALANAGVDAATISYVEAHGTATPLGDPIEIQALTRAFRAYTEATGFCAIGSVKGNIGHLDAAAGIAGLLKTVLALAYRQIPPSLHFERPNPNIDFAHSPFYVNTFLADWNAPKKQPRRAGVSAFGVGGTNAHVILEETPPLPTGDPSRPWQLLLLSGKTETAVSQISDNLANYLAANPAVDLADVAYTLQVGRQAFAQRRFVLAQDAAGAIQALNDPEQILRGTTNHQQKRSLAFMFPGQGAQYPNMGRDLYEQEPIFRQEIDHAALMLRRELGFDLRQLLYPEPGNEAEAAGQLQQTAVAQPALFVTNYALARLWYSWGIEANALIGHSLGEYVAACLANVFSLEDGLKLVAARGRLMQALPTGAMLAVPLSEFEVQPFLDHQLAVAAVNGPSRCVLAGPHSAIDQVAQQFNNEGLSVRRLHTSHAFHSAMMEPVLDSFLEVVNGITLHPPQIPYLSNTSGTWMTAEEATNPTYWVNHLRHTVRFSDNLAALLADSQRILLELGPGDTLSQLARQHPAHNPGRVVVPGLRQRPNSQDDLAASLNALGRLWLAGIEPDWGQFYGQERRRRLPLPVYPFAKQRYWIEPRPQTTPVVSPAADERKAMAEWLYLPTWQRMVPPPHLDRAALTAQPRRWLLLADEQGMGLSLTQTLTALGQAVVMVHQGSSFRRGETEYSLNPARRADYDALMQSLREDSQEPDVVLHLWSLSDPAVSLPFAEAQTGGYHSLLYLLQAMTADPADLTPVSLLVITNQVFALTAQETVQPEKATLLGVGKVIPQEYEPIHCQVVDVGSELPLRAVESLLGVAIAGHDKPLVYRGSHCWEQVYQPIAAPAAEFSLLRSKGVYLLTGGLVEIGVEMAHFLARSYQARLILLEEAPFPPAEQWDHWLQTHNSHHPICEKITQARQLSQQGAEVLTFAVDWENARQIETAVAQAVSQFGPINGVIHNARVLGERSFRTLAETGPAESAWQFMPKVYGLMNVAQAVGDQPLDFFLLNSSLSSVLGGPGMVAYAAANSFMDAFARQQNLTYQGIWTSVNWDAWQGTQVSAVSPYWAKHALTPTEGTAVLQRIWRLGGLEQVVVSTVDLQTRLVQQKHTSHRPKPTVQQTLHPRPDLPTVYAPPTHKREQLIAEIWQEMLGIEKVGVLDNFFELGGDSLLAIQTIAQLQKRLQMDIPVASLYEGVTVRALAQVLDGLEQEAAVTQETLALEDATRDARVAQRKQMQEQQRAKRRERQLG